MLFCLIGYLSHIRYFIASAEAVRFELTVPCDTTVFKTVDLNHSSTLPGTIIHYLYLFSRGFCQALQGATNPGLGYTEGMNTQTKLIFALSVILAFAVGIIAGRGFAAPRESTTLKLDCVLSEAELTCTAKDIEETQFRFKKR